MKVLLRFVLPLGAVLSLIALASMFLVDHLTLGWFSRDLDVRAKLISSFLEPVTVSMSEHQNAQKLVERFEQVARDERLLAVAFCQEDGTLFAKTSLLPDNVQCSKVRDYIAPQTLKGPDPGGAVHVSVFPVSHAGQALGRLVLVHDMQVARRRTAATRFYIFILFLVIALLVSIVTIVMAKLTWRSWVLDLREFIRRRGEERHGETKSFSPEIVPVVNELRSLVDELESNKRLSDSAKIIWDPKTLKDVLCNRLAGNQVLVVANREPYIHNMVNDKVEVQVPASGMVTALEPILRACSGTWIAHGSGSADRLMVDDQQRVAVPPGEESYWIKRLWLTEDEENGYYYGFANEGLWPLCHIAHTRPIFRTEDWEYYKEVNRRFADAVAAEAKSDDPVILVQDYHFAMLPALIRERIPQAVILTFWHIPWPNAEIFGICPWRQEILAGLLGSTILGFHTRFHRNNFLDTVDRYHECRIDREKSAVSHQGHLTLVRPYPISIEWPPRNLAAQKPITECRQIVKKRLGISADVCLGLGVDRLDYTKGIVERLSAVRRLFELHQEWCGKFTFIQIAAPSRSKIDSYRMFEEQVKKTAAEINKQFGESSWKPVILLVEHHSPASVYEHFRAVDLCLVTSLHDGMNLVAKEFIASREDEQGVLILSMFTGASRELPEALIVNPYSIDNCAEAMYYGLIMSPEEKKLRMSSLRQQVKLFNVYRWAGRMLIDAADVREKERMRSKFASSEISLEQS